MSNNKLALKRQRCEQVNQAIQIIATHGRRFFYSATKHILSLSLSASLLIGSKAARQKMRFMMFFIIAILMVFAIGFVTFNEPSTSSDQLAQMLASMMSLAKLLAKVFMYVVPGALTVYYSYLAYEGLAGRAASAQALLNQAE